VGQTDQKLCADNDAVCGSLTVTDQCNTVREIDSCGSCVDPETCDGIGHCACVPETNAELCAAAGQGCGSLTVVDKCGNTRTIGSCGICAAPAACTDTGQCLCAAQSDAQFCTANGRACGSFTGLDNCGVSRTVPSCGTCLDANTCSVGVCTCPAETTSAFCLRMGATCGPVSGSDLCGNPKSVASCGTCFGNQTCGGGATANVCGCTPESDTAFCAARSKDCGSVTGTDTCGVSRTASCGVCTSPQTCGGGTTANVCGCTAETNTQFCTRLGKNCGSVTANDNCGAPRTVTCGTTCTAPKTCGGGGTANVCGCTAETDAQLCTKLGKNCGAVTTTDSCGVSRTLDCGATCPTNTTCGGGGTANVCGCTAETDTAFCTRLAKNCGAVTAADNCGAQRTAASCGTCAATSVCGAVTPNLCAPYQEPFSAICNPEGYCWENPLPFGNTLQDVQVVAADDIWAVGSEQLLLHYDGTGWSGSFDGKKPALRAIWANGGSDLWAVGDSGSVLHRQGGAWTPVTIAPATNNLTSVFGFGAGDLWVGGSYTAWHYNGSTATPYSLPGAVTGLWGSSSTDVWAVGKGSTYGTGFIAHWNGTSWTQQSGITWAFEDVFGFGASDVWAVAQGHVVHWNGAYWADVSNLSCTSIWGTSSTNLWLSCGGAMKRYDGTIFTNVATPSTSVKLSGDASGALVSVGTGLDREVNGQWVRVAPTQTVTTSTIASLQIFSGGDAVAHLGSGLGNLVRRSGVWNVETEAVKYNHCTWGTSADDYWIGSDDSSTHTRPFAYHKTGGTLVSTNLATYDTGSISLRYPETYAMWGSGPSDVHAVGELYWDYYSGSYYYEYGFFHFDGTSWLPVTIAYTDTGADSVVSFIDGASATEVWAADTGHMIWKLLGGSFQRFNTGSPLQSSDAIAGLWVQSATRTYVTGSFGVLTFDGATGYGPKQPVPAWAPAASSVVRGVRQSGSAPAVAVGESGQVGVSWIYNGTAWQVQSVFPAKLRAIALDGTQIVVVGESGTMYRKP
jgi:hypothetical protein